MDMVPLKITELWFNSMQKYGLWLEGKKIHWNVEMTFKYLEIISIIISTVLVLL